MKKKSRKDTLFEQKAKKMKKKLQKDAKRGAL